MLWHYIKELYALVFFFSFFFPFLLCAVVWDVLLILLLLFDSSTTLRGERCSDEVSSLQNPVLWERGSSSAERMFFLWSPLPRVMRLLLTSLAPWPVSMSVIDKWLTVQKVRGVGLGLPASSRSAVEYFIGTQMCCCLYNCSWLLSLALLEFHEFSLYSLPSVELHLYSQSSSQFNTFAASVCVKYTRYSCPRC